MQTSLVRRFFSRIRYGPQRNIGIIELSPTMPISLEFPNEGHDATYKTLMNGIHKRN